MVTFASLDQLLAQVGKEVAVSDWVLITQEQINLFAQATGDDQWIHVDVERAKAGPFGAPIAHGFLTLSLIPQFFQNAVQVTEPTLGVNYGLNRVRFMAPVPVGSRLRARMTLLEVQAVSDAGAGEGVQMTWDLSIEREGLSKPVCVAQSVVRRYRRSA